MMTIGIFWESALPVPFAGRRVQAERGCTLARVRTTASRSTCERKRTSCREVHLIHGPARSPFESGHGTRSADLRPPVVVRAYVDHDRGQHTHGAPHPHRPTATATAIPTSERSTILTYPNQYQQPGPGYPGPYAVGQPAPQAHPGPPAQQFAQPQSAPAAPPSLGFQDPSRGVGANSPAVRHLVDRTVVMVPKRIDQNSKYDGQVRPTAYVDLYVIDGGPLTYGDSEDRVNPRPPTHTIETPAFFPNAMIGNQAIVSEIESKIDPSGRPTGISVGVVVKPEGKRYYALTPCATDANRNDRPDGAQRRAAAESVYMRHQSRDWTPPVPVPLGQAPTPQAPTMNYGPPQQGYVEAPGPFTYANPNPQWAAGPGGLYPVGDPRYAQQAAQQSAPPVQAFQPTTPGAGTMPPAPGWEANPAWSQFTQEAQMSIWQQVNAAGSGQPSGAGAPAAAPHQPTAGGPGW